MSTLRVVELDELKQQMRVDFEEEDSLIMLYGEAAESAVINGTGRSVRELCRMGYAEVEGEELRADEELPGSSETLWFPKTLKLAILMLAAHFYRNREPVACVGQNVVPYAYEVLCKPYKKLS